MRHTKRENTLPIEIQEEIRRLRKKDSKFGLQRTKPTHLKKDKGYELMSYEQTHYQHYMQNNNDS